jgi:hypothetical protein
MSWQECRDEHVRHVHQLADLEVDGDAAYDISLLAGPTALAEVIDHRGRITGSGCVL